MCLLLCRYPERQIVGLGKRIFADIYLQYVLTFGAVKYFIKMLPTVIAVKRFYKPFLVGFTTRFPQCYIGFVQQFEGDAVVAPTHQPATGDDQCWVLLRIELIDINIKISSHKAVISDVIE